MAIFAVSLAIGGLGGLLGNIAMSRLPHPGRVRVPHRDARQPESGEVARFRHVSTLNALGFGLMPYFSLYAIVVLGMSPGYAILLSAATGFAGLAASIVAGAFLATGSASNLLRLGFGVRAFAMACALAAFPGNPLAIGLLFTAVVAHASGSAIGGLAHNERLFRLTSGSIAVTGSARIALHGSLANAGGQLASSALLAILGQLDDAAPWYVAPGLTRGAA